MFTREVLVIAFMRALFHHGREYPCKRAITKQETSSIEQLQRSGVGCKRLLDVFLKVNILS
jgi:hypothetical protein